MCTFRFPLIVRCGRQSPREAAPRRISRCPWPGGSPIGSRSVQPDRLRRNQQKVGQEQSALPSPCAAKMRRTTVHGPQFTCLQPAGPANRPEGRSSSGGWAFCHGGTAAGARGVPAKAVTHTGCEPSRTPATKPHRPRRPGPGPHREGRAGCPRLRPSGPATSRRRYAPAVDGPGLGGRYVHRAAELCGRAAVRAPGSR